MNNVGLQIVFRYIHIVSAILAVGGLAFLTFSLLPALKNTDESTRQAILPPIIKRFSGIVGLAILALFISGVFTWISLAKTYNAMGKLANALIGTKVLLALVLFALLWAEASGFIKPKKPRTMIVAKLHMGLLIVLIASVLRCLRLAYMTNK